jgi:transposase
VNDLKKKQNLMRRLGEPPMTPKQKEGKEPISLATVAFRGTKTDIKEKKDFMNYIMKNFESFNFQRESERGTHVGVIRGLLREQASLYFDRYQSLDYTDQEVFQDSLETIEAVTQAGLASMRSDKELQKLESERLMKIDQDENNIASELANIVQEGSGKTQSSGSTRKRGH